MTKLLILGGTRFIGRVLVEQLLEDGSYDITLFNRGQSNQKLFPEVKRIQGDRYTEDLLNCAKQEWDAVIDLSGYRPQMLPEFAQKLVGKVGRYIYLSTVSVYDRKGMKNQKITEEAPVNTYTADQLLEPDIYTHYGKKKKACEDILVEAEGLDTVILRPCVVYGRYDYTDRFYYWLQRIFTQDEILIPAGGAEKYQFTFVDDLTKLLTEAIHLKSHNSIYNATTHAPKSLMELFETIMKIANKKPVLRSVNLDFAKLHTIKPWADLPMSNGYSGDSVLLYDNEKLCRDFKFKFTSFEDSVAQTIAHYQTTNWPEGIVGMRLDREKELIRLLNNSQKTI